MISRQQVDRVRKLLRMAADAQPAPTEGHFVEDDELLTCWSQGLLAPDEHERLIEHLAICPRCRNEVADLIRAGVLEFPEAGAEEDAEQAPAAAVEAASLRSAAVPRKSWFSLPWTRVALAASILVCLGGIAWLLSPSGPSGLERQLARADRDLDAGHPAAAMDRVEPLLGQELDAATQARAEELLKRAGYAAAVKGLSAKDFGQVLEIEHRVSRRVGASPQLLNLKLQAERGVPAEFSLGTAGTLPAYGYELDGSAPRKALPVLDETTQRLDREFRAAVKEYPHSAALWLNRGQFLLALARHDEAGECFAEALKLEPKNELARLGLGLVWFEQQQYEAALKEFQAVVAASPQNVSAQVNAAICLERLGRPADARHLWERVLELTGDARLRQQIEAHLTERNSP